MLDRGKAKVILLAVVLLLVLSTLACVGTGTGGNAGEALCRRGCSEVDLSFGWYVPASDDAPPSCWCTSEKGRVKLW